MPSVSSPGVQGNAQDLPQSSALPEVFIALGANLPSQAGPPLATLEAALLALARAGLAPRKRSRWYESEPVPASDQPWFVNGVVAVTTLETPYNILKILNNIEYDYGRSRTLANAARPLDLDLLACGQIILSDAGPGGLILPHPRLAERGFVLLPWAEIAPQWRHPLSGKTIAEMARAVPPRPIVRRLG